MALTPFGEKLRALRAQRAMSQKDMATKLGVSPAYLSALEHGKRGVPRWIFVQEMIQLLDVIWDDADELQQLAMQSDPRITIDTSQLSAIATELANKLALNIGKLSDEDMLELIVAIEAAGRRSRQDNS